MLESGASQAKNTTAHQWGHGPVYGKLAVEDRIVVKIFRRLPHTKALRVVGLWFVVATTTVCVSYFLSWEDTSFET